jgi:quercetin dioxygenase-like cupin family protein
MEQAACQPERNQMAHPPATATIQIDDARLRVTHWHFAPGQATGWHRHGMDYVVVPLTDGVLTIEDKGGNRQGYPISPDAPYARGAGVEHDVINLTDRPIEFLEIEKKPAP